MNPRLLRYLMGLGLTLVAIVIGAQVYFHLSFQLEAEQHLELGSALPRSAEGWEFESLPLAESDTQLQDIQTILRYDDVFWGVYRKGQRSVYVYVSYWKPGTMAYDLAGFHTPDVCWVESGWKRLERDYAVEHVWAGVPMKPHERGLYQKDGIMNEVIFWHLVGQEPQRYRLLGYDKSLTGRLTRLKNKFADAIKFGPGSTRSQLFVRISSTTPFPLLEQDPSFERLMCAVLTPLSLRKNP